VDVREFCFTVAVVAVIEMNEMYDMHYAPTAIDLRLS